LLKHRFLVPGILILGLAASAPAIAAEGALESDSAALQRMLDSTGLSRSDLEAKVRSTLMFGGSSPVSFSGEARVKAQYHEMFTCPWLLREDRTYVATGWEGNESMLRLGMVARAGRNATLWSKIGFQNTFPGNYLNRTAGDTISGLHDKTNEPAIIHEDMCAGLAVRTVPVSFWLKMGAIHWTEASPLTVWKSQPRTFAWDFLPYEIEQPIARYFEYNIAKGEKTGRAAWHKKPFQGIDFESINLPYNLYLNMVYGMAERFDNFEREYIDFSNDVAYAGDAGSPAKGRGIGDSYRHMFHARIAAKELFNRMTPGVNLFAIDYDRDIVTNKLFQRVFVGFTSPAGRAFYKQPKVGSLDLRGPVTEKLSILGDLALGMVDTTWITNDTASYYDSLLGRTVLATRLRTDKASSPIRPAAFLRIENQYGIPVSADFAYIGRGFYSPLSFAAPADVFFPFGANLIGTGKFIARGEASPYTQNMAGVSLQVAPNIKGYGHLKFTYGQHLQLEAAQDVIAFPYRLGGMDLFGVFHSSYNRWGNDPADHSMTGKYFKRLGDESFKTTAYGNPVGPEGGALHSDYLGMYETFVPYESAQQADSNLADRTTVFTRSPFVPAHRKFTFNAEVDAAYDIGPLIGYRRDCFLSLYGALNGVSTAFVPIAVSDKAGDMLLWGTYVRFEPAIALTSTFYLLGIAGFENWRSQKAYISEDNRTSVAVPIDYRDYAYGVGFDWDMFGRVGLHGRAKWMQHDDISWPANNWASPVVSTEIKLWF
jgi:hypothetical protein